MSDAAFKTAPFPGMTIDEMRAAIAAYLSGESETMTDAKAVAMEDEIARRGRVALNDVSVMTDGERLRWFKATTNDDFAKDAEAYRTYPAARAAIERKWGERAAYFR